MSKANNRHSGIELLRIISIFIIVVHHVTSSLSYNEFTFKTVGIDINYASQNIQYFILQLFYDFGALGNIIFIICSAWFLTDNDRVNPSKFSYIISDQFILYMIFFVIHWCLNGMPDVKFILSACVPIVASNWFLGCYLVMYLIHPLLNNAIHHTSQSQLLAVNIIFAVIYSILPTVVNVFLKGSSAFGYGSIVTFVFLYFMTAYVKKYMKKCVTMKNGCILFFIGIILTVLFHSAVNFLGIRIPSIGTNVLGWASNTNPILTLTGFALFMIFSEMRFKSSVVNYLSSLTLLIYIIHDNSIVEDYLRYRPNIIFDYYNVHDIPLPLLVLLFSVLLFAISFCTSIIYNLIFQKYIHKLSEICTNVIIKLYKWFEKKLIKLY